MKVDRLISIINLLNNNGRMTTSELSKRFEVSSKTIQRDMEAIERAGIPLVTYKGYNGGYEILENFRITKSVMNKEEGKLLKKLLEGISKSYDNKEIKSLNEKLSLVSNDSGIELNDKLIIEFSHWGSNESLKKNITLLDEAIDRNELVSFKYTNLRGESLERKVEPYRLIYKGSNWYVYAYCLIKEDFRLFKIRRMKNINSLEEKFNTRMLGKIQLFNQRVEGTIDLVLKVKKHSMVIVEDMVDGFEILEIENEHTLIKYTIPEDNWIYGMILSLGNGVEVMEPKSVREKIKLKINDMKNIYR